MNPGTGWWLQIRSQTPQSCASLIRTGNTEILESGLGDCPDRTRRVGFNGPYDYRNNPTNYTFRTVGGVPYYTVPSCSFIKITDGNNPLAGGAWSTTETIAHPYNLFVQCPEGFYSHPACFAGTTPWCLPLAGDGAPDPLRNAGRAPTDSGEPKTCNPISVGTGNKYQHEADYVSPSIDALSWDRHYNHLTVFSGNVLAPRWTHGYSRWIATIGSDRAWIHRPDGRMFSARLVNTSISANRQRWTMELNARGQLWRSFDANSQPNGWVLYAPDDATFEVYKVNGQLDTVIRADGLTHQLSYSDGTGGTGGGYVLNDQGAPTTSVLPAGLLIRVASSLGRAISIGYNSALRATFIELPTGSRLRYTFDGAFNVTSITNLDGSAKQYVYGEAANVSSVAMPSALTGIIDENNRRFATYRYDHLGRAVSARHWADSQQTVSVNAVTLAYATAGDGSPTSTTVTDALGTVRTYSFFNLSGLIKQTGQSQPAGSGCAPSAAAMLYDSGGNVSSRTNFNGTKSCYAFDSSRNLETKRVEGLTSSAVCRTALSSPPTGARMISTQWHPDWRLETRIAEPKKLTTITYNGQGATCAPSTVLVDGKPPAVICTRTEQATTDETGAAGFAATVTGTARTWRYTYTTYGRVLTAIDPNNRTTTTSYHPDNDADLGKRGNVASITNAANHTTFITNYNPHGQPTRIVDPNGVVTVLTYDPRMRLTSRTVGNEATVFGYDPVGQMTSVNLPDGARLTYTYDAAHRLTAINDHKGNRIDYTLDAMGNRNTEKTKDPGGVLVGNIARVIDALNRVQQVTGAVQ